MKQFIIPVKRKWYHLIQLTCMALLFLICFEMPVFGQPTIEPDDMISKCDVNNQDLDSIRIPFGTRFVFEVEDAIEGTQLGGWHFDTTQASYGGDGYLVYTGEGKNDTTDPVPLIYIWYVTKAQNYNIWFRNRRDRGEGGCDIDAEGDACNDIYAALDYQASKKKLVKHPFGAGWGWGTPTTDYVPYNML